MDFTVFRAVILWIATALLVAIAVAELHFRYCWNCCWIPIVQIPTNPLLYAACTSKLTQAALKAFTLVAVLAVTAVAVQFGVSQSFD